MDKETIEKLIKTIKNPNVSGSRKLITKDKMVKENIWKEDFDRFLTMTPEELYKYNGIK